MLNIEKYKEELKSKMHMKNERLVYIILEDYLGEDPSEIPYAKAAEKVFNWLAEKYREPTIKITQSIYNILVNLSDIGFKYIVNRHNNTFLIYKDKPMKIRGVWAIDSKTILLGCYGNKELSLILQESESPTLISNILNNCKIEAD